jgi:tRNA-dihydrouridine synthase B
MIGRAAMQHPWIFREIKHYLATGVHLPPPTLEDQWAHIRRHCQREVEKQGCELHAMQSMRMQLMAYSRGMPDAKRLREKFAHVASVAQLDDIAVDNIAQQPKTAQLAPA